MSTASSIRSRANSLKTSILKKLVPIYFIRILKAVTKQSINNLEYAAFLILPVEIKNFFFVLSNILFFQRHLWGDHYGNKVALTFLMLSMPFQTGGVFNRFLAFNILIYVNIVIRFFLFLLDNHF